MGTFKDSLKKWFFTNNSQAASESARIPLLDASGNPIGSDTMINLASVLGGIRYVRTLANVSIDTAIEQGYYIIKDNVSGNPTGGYWGQCIVYRFYWGDGNYMIVQEVYSNTTIDDSMGFAIFKRKGLVKKDNTISWQSWQRIDNYGSKNLKELASLIGISGFTGNVGVAVNESDYLRFRQADEAASIASGAVGVWICECGKLIVVAKDQQASTKWATSNVSGGTTAKGHEDAIADMGGRANTSTIFTTLGENAPAAKYCKEYYPSNVDAANAFVGAGRWWLPSAGELWMIWSHLLEVNRILAQIGGTALNRSQWYWSSTENSATNAWGLRFGNGSFNNGDKTYEGSVRPVSAFY